MKLTGDQLTAQRLLQVIFDGGCADICVGRCACRDEISDALTRAREEGPLPSTSAKQARTMRAAAHDPKFAKKVGIPQSVARDYVAADAAKTRRVEGQDQAKAKRSAKAGKKGQK